MVKINHIYDPQIPFSCTYNIFVYIRKEDDGMKRITKSPAGKNNLVGNKVREFRTEKGLSQQQVADRLELHAVYVCRG